MDRLAKIAGLQDLKTGNESFDRGALIQAASESEALGLLRSPVVQRAILEVFASNKRASVDEYGVHAVLNGIRTDPQEIRPLFDLLTRTVVAVESTRSI